MWTGLLVTQSPRCDSSAPEDLSNRTRTRTSQIAPFLRISSTATVTLALRRSCALVFSKFANRNVSIRPGMTATSFPCGVAKTFSAARGQLNRDGQLAVRRAARCGSDLELAHGHRGRQRLAA